MNHKMWAKWKDFRLDEATPDHEGKMAKQQLERSMKYAKMIYKIIDNVDKDGDGGVEGDRTSHFLPKPLPRLSIRCY